jgi:hypothetical protein
VGKAMITHPIFFFSTSSTSQGQRAEYWHGQ